jgi:hypothetical protein
MESECSDSCTKAKNKNVTKVGVLLRGFATFRSRQHSRN